MPAPPASLLVLQNEIAARLRSLLPDVVVATPADLAGEDPKAGAASGAKPVVNVVYMGHKPSAARPERSDGRALVLLQLIVVEAVVYNPRDLAAGGAARADAGVLSMRCLLALMGHRPPSGCDVLRLRPGPGPTYRAGLQTLPLAVEASLALHAAP